MQTNKTKSINRKHRYLFWYRKQTPPLYPVNCFSFYHFHCPSSFHSYHAYPFISLHLLNTLWKSSRHQSSVVLEPPEVHTILHMAPLPLANPEDTGPAAAPPASRPLSLLHPWIPGQEAVGGMMGKGKTAGRPLSFPPFCSLFLF